MPGIYIADPHSIDALTAATSENVNAKHAREKRGTNAVGGATDAPSPGGNAARGSCVPGMRPAEAEMSTAKVSHPRGTNPSVDPARNPSLRGSRNRR